MERRQIFDVPMAEASPQAAEPTELQLPGVDVPIPEEEGEKGKGKGKDSPERPQKGKGKKGKGKGKDEQLPAYVPAYGMTRSIDYIDSVVQTNGNTRCTLCRLDFGNRDICLRAVCNHVFHEQCWMDPWSQHRRRGCPNCQGPPTIKGRFEYFTDEWQPPHPQNNQQEELDDEEDDHIDIPDEDEMPLLEESEEVLPDADGPQEEAVTPDGDEEQDAVEDMETGYMINTTQDERTNLKSWPGERLQGVAPKGRLAVMIDLGSAIDVGGAGPLQEMTDAASEYGYSVKITRKDKPLIFGGVGAGGSRCVTEALVPIAVRTADRSAIMIPYCMNIAYAEQAQMPAILGARTLSQRDSVICLRKDNEFIAFPGKKGYSILWSPDTKIIPLTRTKKGHYLMECDHYGDLPTFKHRDGAINAAGFFWTDLHGRPE